MIPMQTVKTFTCSIYAGLKKRTTGETLRLSDAREVCRAYCDMTGFCVSFTETEFIYTLGSEPGVIVGLINYPRFPKESAELRERALVLAEQLRKQLCQQRVSIVFSDETVMLCE
jgi:hypothetical protein